MVVVADIRPEVTFTSGRFVAEETVV